MARRVAAIGRALLLLLCACALPAQAAKQPQFTHRSWTSSDGIPGMISALAQTPDGYLWLATYEGLYRFDGVTFERIPPAAGHPAGAIPATGVFVTRRGELWVGYAGRGGVEVYRGGRLVRVEMPNAPGEISGFEEDQDGGLYAIGGREPNRLMRYWRGRWQPVDQRWGIPPELVSSVLAARDGTVWVTTKTHLLFLRPGASRFEDTGERLTDGYGLAQNAQGEVWISGAGGTRMVPDYAHGQRQPHNGAVYPANEPVRRVALIFDHDGAIWGTTYIGGVFHINAPGRDPADNRSVAHFGTANGLTSNQAVAILQDREGNLWVATEIGLDQFRRADVEVAQLPPRTSSRGYRMAADRDGAVYIGSGPALYRADPGAEPVMIRSGEEPTALCADPRGGIWMATPDRVERLQQGRTVTVQPLPGKALVSGCAVDGQGRLWLARPDSSFLSLDRGHWREIAAPLGSGRPKDVVVDRDGNPALVLSGRAIILLRPNAPPLLLKGDAIGVAGLTGVFCSDYGLLVAGGTGLALWDGHRFRRLSIDDQPWLRGVRGLVETARGETWMLNNRGITRVATDKLRQAFDHPREPIPHLFLGEQDGLSSHSNGEDGPQASVARDGLIWFLTRQGPVRVDPDRLSFNRIPPTVLIRGLDSNGRHYGDPAAVKLPAGTHNLSIDYTALSLSVPSRVAFRYKLEGVDPEWIDPGSRRQAFYTNLRPGPYRFRVIAANDKGVWNREGAELRFTIAPTFVESRLFYALCALLALLLLWFVYDLRVRALSRRMRIRLAERISERERIARELHDTLLQGIQALMLRFHVAAQAVRDDDVRQTLDDALDRAEDVLVEGRQRVSDLRETDVGDDLESAILALVGRNELPPATKINVTVKGKPRPVDSAVVAEIDRIVGEALFNIGRHAHAMQVLVELAFHRGDVAILVSDDGVGMPDAILKAGVRTGHFGLPGMRERATQLGARLSIRSEVQKGTEVRLIIPARIAFRNVDRPARFSRRRPIPEHS